MRSWLNKSQNTRHMFVYCCLLVFWFCLRLFSQHSFDLGWGFFPLVISLPFVPFILVWLAIQFYRHLRQLMLGITSWWHYCHCVCTAGLFILLVANFLI